MVHVWSGRKVAHFAGARFPCPGRVKGRVLDPPIFLSGERWHPNGFWEQAVYFVYAFHLLLLQFPLLDVAEHLSCFWMVGL